MPRQRQLGEHQRRGRERGHWESLRRGRRRRSHPRTPARRRRVGGPRHVVDERAPAEVAGGRPPRGSAPRRATRARSRSPGRPARSRRGRAARSRRSDRRAPARSAPPRTGRGRPAATPSPPPAPAHARRACSVQLDASRAAACASGAQLERAPARVAVADMALQDDDPIPSAGVWRPDGAHRRRLPGAALGLGGRYVARAPTATSPVRTISIRPKRAHELLERGDLVVGAGHLDRTERFETSTVFPRKMSAYCMTWARVSPSWHEILNSASSRATVSPGSRSRILISRTCRSCLVTWSIGCVAPSTVSVKRRSTRRRSGRPPASRC